jgi:hypothetical protein
LYRENRLNIGDIYSMILVANSRVQLSRSYTCCEAKPRLSETPPGTIRASSSRNMDLSRAPLFLLLLFAKTAGAQYLLSPSLPHAALGAHTHYTEADQHKGSSACTDSVGSRPLSESQRSLERRIARGTFSLHFRSGDEGGFPSAATGFLASNQLLITNRHVVKELLGGDPERTSPEEISAKIKTMDIRNPLLRDPLHPTALEHCFKEIDICILRIANPGITDESGQPVIRPLRLKESTAGLSRKSWLGIVGNFEAKGLQASSANPVKLLKSGSLLHCIPTSPLSSGGNSGSPVFNAAGEIVAVDGYSLALDSNCQLRGKSTGLAITTEAIFENIQRESPDLKSELLRN